MPPDTGNVRVPQGRDNSPLQHKAGGREGVPIYVRMNVSYDQTVAKGSLQKATSIWAWVQLVGQW